jgi:hypothetical protein
MISTREMKSALSILPSPLASAAAQASGASLNTPAASMDRSSPLTQPSQFASPGAAAATLAAGALIKATSSTLIRPSWRPHLLIFTSLASGKLSNTPEGRN